MKIFTLTTLIFLLSALACSQIPQIEDSIFPDGTWQTAAPESLGYSSKKLNKAQERFESTGGVAALVIVKGRIIADWGDTDAAFDCRSIRKSFLSSLFGIYQEKGMIDINKSLSEAGINDQGKMRESELQTQIKYLMSSSSGIYLPATFESAIYQNKPARGSSQPGDQFFYNNWDFNVLSTVFNQSTGRDLFEAFGEHIAKPLQMEHFDPIRNTGYLHQPAISEHPAYMFRVSSKDLARFGLLYLNEGNWKGKQLVPKSWVIESTSQRVETGDDFYYNYGYLWWVSKRQDGPPRKPFLARGAQSQYLYVDPNNDLIVIFRDNPDDNVEVKKSDGYPLLGAVYQARL